MIKISNRLIAVASLISEDCVLADVGTDHGFVPIYLMQQKRIKRAIAMDINRGPLERAKEHIALFGMGEYIETRLSDGVEALHRGEADSILIAGMGGALVIHILDKGSDVCQNAKELILQPQSELERVRTYLEENGYVTDAEEMVLEDDKFYPMMRVHYCSAPQRTSADTKLQMDAELRHIYGAGLLAARHPVLHEYLFRERQIYQNIYRNLRKQPDAENIKRRCKDIEEVLVNNKKALSYYDRA